MANPPITIGPYPNVPAPGSPIRSNWPQQITRGLVDTIQAGTALTAGSPPAGTLKMYAGTATAVINASYLAEVPIPAGVFPGGLLTVLGSNGDQGTISFVPMTLSGGAPASGPTRLQFVCMGVTAGAWAPIGVGTTVRINYLAVGW